MRSREEIEKEIEESHQDYQFRTNIELLLDIRELLQEKEKPENKTTEKMEELMNKKYKEEKL